jgi:iron complex transport system substrate-binding protein
MIPAFSPGPRATGPILAALLTAAIITPMADAAERRPRVMSIDNCGGQYLLALADRDQIVSLPNGGDDTTLPFLLERSKGIPRNKRSVEEIIATRPDILLSGPWSGITAATAKSFGIRIVRVEAPRDIPAARKQILDLAKLLGHEERGRELAERIDRQTEAARQRPRSARMEGIVYRSGGYAYGTDTLVNSIMEVAGIDNIAARLGRSQAGTIEMETLLMAGPELLLDDHARDLRAPRIATDFLAHPALRRAMPDVARIQFPMAYWLCGGAAVPLAVDSLATLVEFRSAPQVAKEGAR